MLVWLIHGLQNIKKELNLDNVILYNDTAENRSKNRRTRIVVLPKLDQFYDLIEQGMQGGAN